MFATEGGKGFKFVLLTVTLMLRLLFHVLTR